VAAHPSQDLWALGCVLFHLFAGQSLFHSDDEDCFTDQASFRRVLGWAGSAAREERLSHIAQPVARYLVSQLLSADPALRPSAQHVLAHPFFSGRAVGRMVGQEAQFDVFISYRVDSDAATASALFDRLTARGLRVWLDSRRLVDGENWEQGFCTGLIQSRCLVPVISRAALKQRFESLREDSPCDNVLLEHRLAGELQARGLIEKIFPVFVGEVDAATGHFGDYFAQGGMPAPASAACVQSVEAKLVQHLEAQGLGLPLKAAPSVRDVLASITVNQGGKVLGAGTMGSILDGLADRVQAMVADLGRAGAAGVAGGGAAGSATAAIDDAAAQEVVLLRAQLAEARRRLGELERGPSL
jgi:hypothetical protein